MPDVFLPELNTSRAVAGEDLVLWRPLSLAGTFRQASRSRSAQILLLVWLGLTAICIALGVYQVKLAWNALPVHLGPVRFSVTVYPPLVICLWMVFWLGFEWAFFSAYLATFCLALYSGMRLEVALLFALVDPLALAVYALAYRAAQIPFDLRSLKSVLWFVFVSFLAAVAGSAGSFIWSDAHGLPPADVFTIWQGWWVGALFQAVVLNAPVLAVLGRRLEQLKSRYFQTPPRSEPSLTWVMVAIGTGGLVVAGFLLATSELAGVRLSQALGTDMSEVTGRGVLEAIYSWKLTVWTGIILTLAGSIGGILLAYVWNRSLFREVGLRTAQLHEAELVARESADVLRSQNQALKLIAEGASLQETLDLLVRLIEAQSSGMLCSILLLDSAGLHVRHGAAPSLPESYNRGIDGKPIGPRAGSCGTAAYRREPVIVEDIASDPLWEDYREFALAHGLRACWSTPIFDAERNVLGTFALYFRSPGRPDERHRQLIEVATHTAAIAIVKHRENQALRASEERMRLAAASANLGFWEWNIGGTIVCSDQLKSIFGWVTETQELTINKFWETVYAEDRDRVEARIQLSMKEESQYDTEYRILRKDGSLRWIAARGRCEYDGKGHPVRMLGVALDITDRKRAQEEIRRRESQLAEAQSIAKLGSYEWDVRNNTVYPSPELCHIFGVPDGQFEPTFESYLNRVHPEDRTTAQKILEQAFHANSPFSFEKRIIHSDGEIRWLHTQGKWVLDNDGNPARLVGICQDITDRMLAEDLLRRSEERFRIVARATNDAIWDWDLATGKMWWNQGISELFRYPTAEVGIDAEWRRGRIHPDDVESVVSAMRAVMDSRKQFWSGEYRFCRADGSYADILDRGFVLYDNARQPVRMIGAMTDITERKRALEILEQRVNTRTAELHAKNSELEGEITQRQRVEILLRSKNEELKSFAYTVSHDLKAPLRGIVGYAQELDRRHRTGLSDRAHFCVSQILTATRNLDRLIEDLLYYSRLDSETPTHIDIDLTRVVDAILQDRKPVIVEQNATVQLKLSAVRVCTWERGLLQVLTNLIDNALKYSRNAQPPCVRITSEDLRDRWRIVISDNGVGFDMKYHDRIFGLFNRLVRQEEFEGTGAGLAIAKKVVEKLGGRIWAESAPQAGAKFFLELPKGLSGGLQ